MIKEDTRSLDCSSYQGLGFKVKAYYLKVP